MYVCKRISLIKNMYYLICNHREAVVLLCQLYYILSTKYKINENENAFMREICVKIQVNRRRLGFARYSLKHNLFFLNDLVTQISQRR